MSHPDPRPPAEANGAYPYELPVHDSAITGTGTGMPGTDTRQYEEWHHATRRPAALAAGTPCGNSARLPTGQTREYS